MTNLTAEAGLASFAARRRQDKLAFMQEIANILQNSNYRRVTPAVSAVSKAGNILELVYHSDKPDTEFVVWRDGNWSFKKFADPDPIYRFVPYSPHNNLIKNEVVLFPSEPVEYQTEEVLVAEIQAFIHRYVDVSHSFEKIASYYVLLTWLYDNFNELPYLRVRGDPGSGKTRFLLTVGSICYKPIFASGASTVSPIFRIMDAFRGTLIIDESDFRLSDEKAEIIKILNNGNVRGFPVLRSEVSGKGEYNPYAYQVFGPKIIATRGYFDDRALESRFLTEAMVSQRLRRDVPINLPKEHRDEALRLRNKLLLFRFRNFGKSRLAQTSPDRNIEPRLSQIFTPLLSIITDPVVEENLRQLAREYGREMVAERGMDAEAQVLEVIRSLIAQSPDKELSVGEITTRFSELHAHEYDRAIHAKWIGMIIRRRLGLKAYRGRDGYRIGQAEFTKLEGLYEKYGIGGETASGGDPLGPTGERVNL